MCDLISSVVFCLFGCTCAGSVATSLATIASEIIRSEDTPGEVCLDTWTTFNDAMDPVQYQPFKPSKDSDIFLYNQVNLDESKFPSSCCRDNLQRVADILVKFPRKQLSVLDEHYEYQVYLQIISEIKSLY